jgi:hypothetical protein
MYNLLLGLALLLLMPLPLAIVALVKLGRLQERVEKLERRLAAASPAPAATASVAPAAPPTPAPTPLTAPLPERATRHPRWHALAGDRWQRWETLLAEHWTGLLGSLVVVAGVTFLMIYAALRLPPAGRAALTGGIAAALAGAGLLLQRRAEWQRLAEGLRSAAAALALFACAASGALPQLGLRWIEQPLPAFALLGVGLVLNLALAWRSRTQGQASLHVLLALTPLAVVPGSLPTLLLGAAIALTGLALALRAGWDLHWLRVLLGYGLFHALWALHLPPGSGRQSLELAGALVAVAVLLAALLVHHRPGRRPEAAALPWLVGRATAGVLLVLALLLQLPPGPLRALLLLGSAALLGMLAWRLRHAEPGAAQALHLADLLLAQLLVLAGLLSLLPVARHPGLLWFGVFIESLLFHRLTLTDRSPLPAQLGWPLALLAGVAQVVASLWHAPLPETADVAAAGLLAASALAAAGALTALSGSVRNLWFQRNSGDGPAPCWLGRLAGLLAVASLWQLVPSPWMSAAALVLLAALAELERHRDAVGLWWGTRLALVAAHLLGLWILWDRAPWAPLALLQHLGPLAALALFTAWRSPAAALQGPATHLLWLCLAAAAWHLTAPIAALAPGVLWLLLSVAALETAGRLGAARERQARASLRQGYLLLLAFVVHFGVFGLQVPDFIGGLRLRWLVEAFAGGVTAWWWWHHASERLAAQPDWRRLQPFLLEVGLFGVSAVVWTELPEVWRPLAWSLLALGLRLPAAARWLAPRAHSWSLLFFWLGIGSVAAALSVYAGIGEAWYQRADIAALVALLVQASYLFGLQRWHGGFAAPFPAGLGWLGRATTRLAPLQQAIVFHPWFAGIALFLYWRFDRSLLTLLWAAEAFGIFVLAAVLRQNAFRHVALAGLTLCLARLVWLDMAESNLALRGVVFIGVGLLMLGMNAIYNRYRARFLGTGPAVAAAP